MPKKLEKKSSNPSKQSKLKKSKKIQKAKKESGFSHPEKTDFSPLYKEHKVIMNQNGCDIDAMIQLRHKIHQNPEGGYAEI